MSESILERLEKERVFEIFKFCGESTFNIIEGCDRFYGVGLTKQEMIQLGNEIIDMANKDD